MVPECDEGGYDERDVQVEEGFVEGVSDWFACLEDYDDECHGTHSPGDEHLVPGQLFAELLPAHWDSSAFFLRVWRD